MSVPASPSGTPRALFLGLGGAGSNFVKALERVVPAAGDCPRQAVQPVAPAWASRPLACLVRGGGIDPAASGNLADEALACALASGAGVVVLLTGLGGWRGGQAIAPVAEALHARGVRVVLPFAFEGRDRGRRAEAQHQALVATGVTVCAVSNQRLLDAWGEPAPDGDRSLLRLFREAEKALLPQVWASLLENNGPPAPAALA